MNEIIKSLMERKSMRVYEDREIAKEDKELILNAAMAAPSAGCQQMYTIIDVTDQKLKEVLAITCDNQPFIATGKMVLIFCADFQKWYDAFELGGCNPRIPSIGDFVLATEDATIAAQNAVVAAESLGIGSCYIGDIMENYEKHKELLNLPDYVFPSIMLVFGYPIKAQKERKKLERADLSFIVHENGYRALSEEELQHNLGKNTSKPYAEWIKHFCNFKYNSDFSREMSRSIKEALKKFE